MSKSGTIKMWVAVMLVTAFAAGGTTFLFLGRLIAQPIPPPAPNKIAAFRKQWIETYRPTPEQIDQLEGVLKRYQEDLKGLSDKMHREYNPHVATLMNATEKSLDGILTPEQRAIYQREVERRRQKADELPPKDR